MPHEIASQILAEAPIDAETLSRLQSNYGFNSGRLEQNQKAHRMVIGLGFDELQSMIDMSRPETLDPVVAYHDDPPAPKTPFEQKYDAIRRDPLQKMLFDQQYIDEFLRKLGPTNQLRRADGMDSSFELGRMRRLLQKDYAALPEQEKRPELRMTEALISEELALLWLPSGVDKAARAPSTVSSLIANTEDVNVVESSLVDSMSAQDRWKLAGAQLSAEAAELFRGIAASPTIKKGDELEAMCREADMEIRRLSILSNLSTNIGSQRQFLRERREQVADTILQTMVEAWLDPDIKKEVKRGKLLELLAVVDERRKLMAAGASQHLVRLALPREDQVHERIGMPADGHRKINLSSDIIVEDISTGKFVAAYQAKAMTSDEHTTLEAAKLSSGRNPMTYDKGRVAMRFLNEKDVPTSVSKR